MKFCIICKNENEISEVNPISDEHIIPEFAGGGLVTKNVCKACNGKMGGGFEGRLAKSHFYTIPQYVYAIAGKKRKVIHPFSGTYSVPGLGEVHFSQDGIFTVIPGLDVRRDGDKYTVSGVLDARSIADVKNQLFKRIGRKLKSENIPFSPGELSVAVDDFLKSAQLIESERDGIEVEVNAFLDIDDQEVLFFKIGYELAVYHFGQEYLGDALADRIRLNLRSQKNTENLHILFPGAVAGIEGVFSDEYHWVLFVDNKCYVKIFNLDCVFEYCTHRSPFSSPDGVVYRFCYKSRQYKSMSFLEHLSSLR